MITFTLSVWILQSSDTLPTAPFWRWNLAAQAHENNVKLHAWNMVTVFHEKSGKSVCSGEDHDVRISLRIPQEQPHQPQRLRPPQYHQTGERPSEQRQLQRSEQPSQTQRLLARFKHVASVSVVSPHLGRPRRPALPVTLQPGFSTQNKTISLGSDLKRECCDNKMLSNWIPQHHETRQIDEMLQPTVQKLQEAR